MRPPFRLFRRSLLTAGVLLAGLSRTQAQAPLVDGGRDAVYGAPLAVQGTPTGFGNSTQGSQLLANGSELDAVYARINNGVLYLLLTGNLESNGNKLEVFFDTKSGGQNVLAGTNPDVDGDGLNRLAGLTFDAGFEADYYLTMDVPTGTLSAYYATLNDPTNVGATLVSGASTNLPLTFPGSLPTGEIGLDNSNTGGVSGSGLGTPAAATTGIEMAIPLAAIGSPTANFRICAFVNGQNHAFVSNQVLGAIPNGFPNPGDPSGVSFTLLPGAQTVLIPVAANPPARALLRVVPGGAIFSGVPTGSFATQDLKIFNAGTAALTLSAPVISNPKFSTTSGARTIAAGDSATLTVRFTPTNASTEAGLMLLTSNDPNQPTVEVPLLGTGVAPSVVTVDGTKDTGYGTALALQSTPTGFGNNLSELNAAYAKIDNGKLYLLLTGNLEANGNPIELFFDTQSGGQNVLAANNPNVDNNALNAMSAMKFDAGFEPDFYVTVRGNGAGASYTLTGGYTPLNGAGGNGTVLTNGTAGSFAPLDFGGGNTGAVAINNSNVDGVSDQAVNDPSTVVTGIEFEIPLAAIGNPPASFKVAAMVNGGSHNFMSNQVLAGLPLGTPNLGAPAGLDFTTFAGDQFFTVPQTPTGTANISVTPNPLALGNVTVGSTGTGTLTVTNSGNGALVISGIASSNVRFSVTPTTATVPAGGSVTLTVTFAPTSTGAQTGTLSIASNANGAPLTTVNLTGTGTPVGTPQASLSATALNFGSVAIGQNPTQTFRIRNRGNGALNITNISSSNGRFSAAAPTATVAAGDSMTVTVTFSPITPGPQTGTLTVASNDPANPSLTLSLNGTGVTPPVITVDGAQDTGYGTALTLQTNSTGFGDAAGGNQDTADGSELDAAYARIANGNLYLLLTGNLETNGNRLDLFFDTNSGTGQRVLGANNPNTDNNGLNLMAGLGFDRGFTADYYMTLGATAVNGVTLEAYYAPVNGGGGNGVTLTSGAAGRIQPVSFGVGTGQIGLDNSNSAGVNATNAGSPAAVTTGMEFAIPLVALGNPTGPIRVAAFINNQSHSFISNQVLAPLPIRGNLGGDGNGNFTGNVAGVNFANYTGNQFFTIPNGTTASVIAASTNVLAFGNVNVGSSGNQRLVFYNVGNAPLTISGMTSSNALFSVAPTTGTVAAGDSLVVTATFSPTAAGAESGTLTITSNDPGQPTISVGLTGTGVVNAAPAIAVTPAALSFGNVAAGSSATRQLTIKNTGTAPLSLTGIVPGALEFSAAPSTGTIAPGDSLQVTVTFSPTATGSVTATMLVNSNAANMPTAMVSLSGTGITPPTTLVDGTLDNNYGTPLAVQTTPTGFGDSNQGNQTTANGSELDAAYARIDNGMLYLLLTGNLESNGNKLELFFDTQTGGQSPIAGGNANVDNDALAKMTGLTFDNGFAPEYYLTTNATAPGGALTLAAHFAALTGTPLTGSQIGNGPGTNINLDFGGGNTGILGLNNANTSGVSGTAVNIPAGVTTGIEFAIPLAALGNPTGPIRVCAFINGQSHDFASNQVLGGLPNGTGNLGGDGAGNFTGTLGGVNFAHFAGDQFFTIPNGAAVANIGWNVFGINLGSSGVGVPVSGTITLHSTGTIPLVISGITSDNPMFTFSPANATVAPGDSLVLTVTFTPTVGGNQNGTLTITSNAQITPSLQLALIGTTIAGLPADQAGSVALYPNPAADGRATLRVTGKVQITGDIELLDALGRTVRRLSAAPTTELNGLTPGVYTLRLPTNYGPVTRRLVVR